MADNMLKVGCRVLVSKKSVKGTVEYIGNTSFSPGKWVGINLDEPKGKNNGTVEEKVYFKCEENHGVFLRQSQLIILDDNDVPLVDLTEENSNSKTPKTATNRLSSFKKKTSPISSQPPQKKPEKFGSRLSLASVTSSPSREDLSGSTTSLSTPQPTSITKRTSSFVEKTPGKGKQIPSLVKSGSKPPSLAARKSLSRESISKSRSHSKDDISGSQTGFVETLKPQFTPGQVLTSPSPALSGSTTGINILGGSTNVSLLQQEVENLKDQLKDAQEKYETIMVKRKQDKDRLKELEQMRIQVDQLSEFKARILESKTALQRELQQAKKDAQDAIDARNKHAEEMYDLAETVEMATLDKEMAEEKAESLQMELQEIKDKLEEVTLDYETLKAQLDEASGDSSQTRERVPYEYKQLEQQNARLQETLLKMRDVVAQGKHDYQKLVKDIDQKKSEIAELSRTKEKLSSRVEQLEEQVVDLQEQVDAAVGAETMATTLTYDKMMLQEQVEKLQEEIADLEEMQSTNDQLLEEHREIELEINERLDMTLAKLREAQREKEAAVENLADREQTIHKYREVVTALQGERQDLLTRLEAALNKPLALPESMDYNKVFSGAIAHKRAIDLELRQMELKQKEQHIQFLTAFMPESFMGRKGDHDSILMLLLVPRMLWKCDTLLSHIRDKFPPVDRIHRAAVIKEDSVVRYSTGARLRFYLHYLQLVLHQYLFGLDSCTPEMLLEAGTKHPELLVQERTLDSYIASVKEERLDENVLTEPLEKCGQVIEALRLAAFPNIPTHASHCVRDSCAALTAACEAAVTDALAIQALLDQAGMGSGVALITQYIALNLDVCNQQLRNIRRRIPDKEAKLNIPLSCISDINVCVSKMIGVVRTFSDVQKKARQAVLLQGESDACFPGDQLEDEFSAAVDRHLDSDNTGTDEIKEIVASLTAVVGKLNDVVENCDYDLVSPSDAPCERPIALRATAVKKEMEQIKILSKKLEDREIDIKELKLSLKMKGDELSEMVIRKDLIEKKLANINKEHEEETVKLKKELETIKAELDSKSKQYDVTLDALQADLDCVEAEKKQLREKLRGVTKKPLKDVSNKFEMSADKATSPTGILTESEGEMAAPGEVSRLRALLHHERTARFQLECKIASNKIIDATATIPGRKVNEAKENEKLEELRRKGAMLRKEVFNSLMPKCVDLSKTQPGEKLDYSHHVLASARKKKAVIDQVNDFSSEVAKFAAQTRTGGAVWTPLEIFPTPEMKAVLEERKPVTVATLTIPVPPQHRDAGRTIPLLLNPQGFNSLIRSISSASA